jgi:hypothetical protein
VNETSWLPRNDDRRRKDILCNLNPVAALTQLSPPPKPCHRMLPTNNDRAFRIAVVSAISVSRECCSYRLPIFRDFDLQPPVYFPRDIMCLRTASDYWLSSFPL